MDNLNDLKRKKMTRGCIPLLTAIMVFSLLAAMPRTANAANITWDGTDLTVANGDVVTLDAAWIGGGTLTVPAGALVTIQGTVTNATNGITFDFGASSSVDWYATYATAGPIGGNVITLTGNSVALFYMGGGSISASGNDVAVFSGVGGQQVSVYSTATVSATGGTAIKADQVNLGNCTISATTGIAIDAGTINISNNGPVIITSAGANAITGLTAGYINVSGENLTVTGNISGALGIFSHNSATVTVNGNINATAGYGIYADANSQVTVTGSITASTGVYVQTGAKVYVTGTVAGAIVAININSAPYSTISNGLQKGGYYWDVYTDNTSYVYLRKGLIPPPPPPPSGVAPRITGPYQLTLTEGYAATSTAAFSVSGTNPVSVTKTSGDDKITWNSQTRQLDIEAGLAIGQYEVVLTASNSVSTFRFTFTLTVSAKVYFLDIPDSSVGGTVTATTSTGNPYLAVEGETVTLTLTPDAGYELVSISVTNDDTRAAIPLSGTGLKRTFVMPAHQISVVAVFQPVGSVSVETLHETSLRAYVENGVLSVSGWSQSVSPTSLKVYTILGTPVYQGVASGDRVEVALPGRGIYIVTDGKAIVKVIN